LKNYFGVVFMPSHTNAHHGCKPLTSATWSDFEQAMGCHQGGDGGCWCAVAPARDYPVIARSSVVKPSLQPGDWYVSCFFVKAGHRRGNAMRTLLQYAVAFAKNPGQSPVQTSRGIGPRRMGRAAGRFAPVLYHNARSEGDLQG